MNTELGELIKQKRIDKGLSQAELANKMGVNVSTISRWESGNKKKAPTCTKQSRG